MLFTAALSLLLSLGASLVAASPVSRGVNATAIRTCGSVPSDEFVIEAEDHFAKNRLQVDLEAAPAVTISVYWHVIYKTKTVSGGYIPKSQIDKSISVLNKDYGSCGVKFTLAATSRTLNANWFDRAGPDNSYQTAMKNSLRKGGANALNIYSVGFHSGSGASLLGYATFPSSYAGNHKDDGVVLLYSTVPGGTSAPYNLGRTLIYEAGHWVGLYHTFQGKCSSPGDSVSDTPPEASPAFGCPVGRNTCSGGGSDPIRNYMDYTDDSCMTNFTPGQCKRLRSQIKTYRGL